MNVYRVTLLNPAGLRLTVFPKNDTHEQPYAMAEREVNADPEHSKLGPWVAHTTERCE